MSPKPQLTLNLALLIIVLGIGGGFQYGLHASVISSPSVYIQTFINKTWQNRYGFPLHQETLTLLWSFIISVYSIGGFLGALSIRYLSVRFGRKKTLLYNNISAILGAALMGFSKILGSFEMVMLGRFVYGVNAGVGLSIHMMYTGESAPRQLRGLITVSAALFIGLGKLTGLILSLRELLGSEALWPLVMAISGLPALLQLATLPFFPDAPRYLLIDKGDKEGCEQAMRKLWGDRDHQAEMDDMLAEKAAIHGEKGKSLVELMCQRAVRWQFLTLLLVCGGLQFIGINVVYFYSYDIFYSAGISTAQISYVALGMGITEVLTVVLCKVYTWMPYCSTMLIFILLLSFGIGPGGVSCPLPSEIFNQSYRPAAFVFTSVMNWIGLLILGFIFPFIVEGLGSFCFIFFLVFCLLMAIFVFLIVPETKGKSIVEIMEEFHQLNYGGKKENIEKQMDSNLLFATRL
ncbi:solute carrier family 2, facilitated glucose transporter member 11-like isoform X2 [Rhinatrema bivittatum]|uniref:solute carrier family 2, facilitated glucose transporter member 11-like isoform X2 n=1 Tax=Rhinatrema bivittatum TaxID=194408 RepID=UPI00112B7239|nr:solute carrier family 2, facilitated glucose transporter member 11-like isoform X2 [Rhinatrema bivittatum]